MKYKENRKAFFMSLLILLFIGCHEKHLWSGMNNADIFDEPDAMVDTMLSKVDKAKLRVMRVWIDFRLEMDENGNALPVGTYDDCILNEIDNLMVKAKQKGIVLLIAFHQHNWIKGTPYQVNEESHGWRKCKTPAAVYTRSLTEGTQEVTGPYFQRGWGTDYLTNPEAKSAYKQRVSHILNHVNPYFGRAWKDIDEVVWAWELQNEPEYLLDGYVAGRGGDVAVLSGWLNEMADYVKGIDPDTYVALGTMDYNETLGNIVNADIYTFHKYAGLPGMPLDEMIDTFKTTTGTPFNKLLLVEELNINGTHATSSVFDQAIIEKMIEVCRQKNVPWMLWEYGYNFDADDIWHANGIVAGNVVPDGVFWGSKVIPAAWKIWDKPAPHTSAVTKMWNVHEMTSTLCSDPASSCAFDEEIIFLDTFSADNISELSGNYRWYDEHTITYPSDFYRLSQGYLNIEAGRGQDLWGGVPLKRGAPILFYPAPASDYSVETFARADDLMLNNEFIQPINTQVGLFLFHDVYNWIFFGLTNHEIPGQNGGAGLYGDGLIVTKTVADSSSIVAEMPLASDSVFLKIDRWQDRFAFYWREENNEEWHLLTRLTQALGSHEAGIGVKTFDFEHPQLYGPAQGYFDYFLITEFTPLRNIIGPLLRKQVKSF